MTGLTTRLRRVAVLGTVVVLAVTNGGCNRESFVGLRQVDEYSPDAHYEVVVTANQDTFSLAAGGLATGSLHNRSERSIYYLCGAPIVFERFRDGAWQDAQVWFVAGCLSRASTVPAGSRSTPPGVEVQQFRTPGTYRFRFLVYKDLGLRHPFSENEASSAPFIVIP